MSSVSQIRWFCFGSVLGCIGCVASHDTALSGRAADAAPKSSTSSAQSADDPGSDEATPIKVGTGDFTPPEVEFNFDVHVPAGEEMLRCMYAAFPTDRGVIAVDAAESHYTVGSHHMLAYRSTLVGVPEGKDGVWDCSDGAWQRDERGSYYEAQQPDEHRELPAGIAHKFQPGEVLILQAHYINTGTKDIDAHVQLKLHTVDVRTVKQEAGTIYFNDVNISIPPHARASVSMTCPISQDINLALLWSHMHERGVHFVATTDDEAAAAALGTLYDEKDWSEPKERTYPNDSSAVLHAGSHITFSCEFQNDSDNKFVFGNSAASNEMCILHGMYWPRMPAFMEQCFLGTTTRTPI